MVNIYIYIYTHLYRRKFRSQNGQYGEMEKQRWEESGREEKKREDRRRERVRRNQMQVRERVEKSRLTVFSNDLWLQRVEK